MVICPLHVVKSLPYSKFAVDLTGVIDQDAFEILSCTHRLFVHKENLEYLLDGSSKFLKVKIIELHMNFCVPLVMHHLITTVI